MPCTLFWSASELEVYTYEMVIFITVIGRRPRHRSAGGQWWAWKKVGTIEATFISFCVGTAALFFMVLFWGKGNILAVSEVPKYQLIVGILGAFYLAIVVIAVPKIGVSGALFAVITGQLFISALIWCKGIFRWT